MTDPQYEPTPVEEVDGPTALAIARLQEVRSEIELLKGEAEVLTQHIAAGLRRSTVITGIDGRPWRATVVRPDPKVKVDLNVLSRVMPAEYYDQATKRVLDTDGFKRLAKAGVVTPEMVQAACTFTDTNPSVRFIPYSTEETTNE